MVVAIETLACCDHYILHLTSRQKSSFLPSKENVPIRFLVLESPEVLLHKVHVLSLESLFALALYPTNTFMTLLSQSSLVFSALMSLGSQPSPPLPPQCWRSPLPHLPLGSLALVSESPLQGPVEASLVTSWQSPESCPQFTHTQTHSSFYCWKLPLLRFSLEFPSRHLFSVHLLPFAVLFYCYWVFPPNFTKTQGFPFHFYLTDPQVSPYSLFSFPLATDQISSAYQTSPNDWTISTLKIVFWLEILFS